MEKVDVVFRVDAGLEIGSGHIMRCLTLAVTLRAMGYQSLFVCRPHKGNLIGFVRSMGFEVLVLSAPSQLRGSFFRYETWLGKRWAEDAAETVEAIRKRQPRFIVVDHYGIDERWEKAISGVSGQLIVIDDLANRRHCCDALIDSSFGRQPKDYESLVGDQARVFTGTDFCMLRSEFLQARQTMAECRRIEDRPQRVLVTLGGVDLHNVTSTVLRELNRSMLDNATEVQVILGEACPNVETVEVDARRSRLTVDVKQGVRNMADWLMWADICVGAVGSSVWERCCLGCPSVVAVVAENQKEGAERLTRAGIVKSFDPSVPGDLVRELEDMDTMARRRLSDRGMKLIDGYGVNRVARAILESR